MILRRAGATLVLTLLVVLAGCSASGTTPTPTGDAPTTAPQVDTPRETTVTHQSATTPSATASGGADDTAQARTSENTSKETVTAVVESVNVTVAKGETKRVSVTLHNVSRFSWGPAIRGTIDEDRPEPFVADPVTLNNGTASGTTVVYYTFPPVYVWQERQATATYTATVSVPENATVGVHRLGLTASASAAADSANRTHGSIFVHVVATPLSSPESRR